MKALLYAIGARMKSAMLLEVCTGVLKERVVACLIIVIAMIPKIAVVLTLKIAIRVPLLRYATGVVTLVIVTVALLGA